MKKVILTLLAIAMSVSAFAQIKVVEDHSKLIGENHPVGLSYALSSITEVDTTAEQAVYHFVYKDMKYKEIVEFKSFTFSGEESLNSFYDILVQQLAAPNKSELTIELGDAMITIVSKRMIGLPYLAIFIADHNGAGPIGYTNIDNTNINKLFGRM